MTLEESSTSLLLETLDPKVAKEVLRHLCRTDLFFLAKEILGYKDLSEETHGPLCRLLEAKIPRRKLIVCPRGSFKSSLGCVAFPIFRALQNPNIRILIDSELFSNSANFIREIRGHLEGVPLTRLFGEFKNRKDWQSASLTIKQRSKNLKEPTFIAGGIGTTRTGQHYDIIVMDDLNSESNSGTPEACDKVYRHYLYNNAILEPNGEVAVIATRYSGSDVVQRIIDTELEDEQRESLGQKVQSVITRGPGRDKIPMPM